jgi:hypothetical protein
MDLTCVKCKGQMQEGFVVDRWPTAMIATWVAGPPEISRLWGVNLRGKQKIPLRTFRCTDCGYTESYAK